MNLGLCQSLGNPLACRALRGDDQDRQAFADRGPFPRCRLTVPGSGSHLLQIVPRNPAQADDCILLDEVVLHFACEEVEAVRQWDQVGLEPGPVAGSPSTAQDQLALGLEAQP